MNGEQNEKIFTENYIQKLHDRNKKLAASLDPFKTYIARMSIREEIKLNLNDDVYNQQKTDESSWLSFLYFFNQNQRKWSRKKMIFNPSSTSVITTESEQSYLKIIPYKYFYSLEEAISSMLYQIDILNITPTKFSTLKRESENFPPEINIINIYALNNILYFDHSGRIKKKSIRDEQNRRTRRGLSRQQYLEINKLNTTVSLQRHQEYIIQLDYYYITLVQQLIKDYSSLVESMKMELTAFAIKDIDHEEYMKPYASKIGNLFKVPTSDKRYVTLFNETLPNVRYINSVKIQLKHLETIDKITMPQHAIDFNNNKDELMQKKKKLIDKFVNDVLDRYPKFYDGLNAWSMGIFLKKIVKMSLQNKYVYQPKDVQRNVLIQFKKQTTAAGNRSYTPNFGNMNTQKNKDLILEISNMTNRKEFDNFLEYCLFFLYNYVFVENFSLRANVIEITNSFFYNLVKGVTKDKTGQFVNNWYFAVLKKCMEKTFQKNVGFFDIYKANSNYNLEYLLINIKKKLRHEKEDKKIYIQQIYRQNHYQVSFYKPRNTYNSKGQIYSKSKRNNLNTHHLKNFTLYSDLQFPYSQMIFSHDENYALGHLDLMSISFVKSVDNGNKLKQFIILRNLIDPFGLFLMVPVNTTFINSETLEDTSFNKVLVTNNYRITPLRYSNETPKKITNDDFKFEPKGRGEKIYQLTFPFTYNYFDDKPQGLLIITEIVFPMIFFTNLLERATRKDINYIIFNITENTLTQDQYSKIILKNFYTITNTDTYLTFNYYQRKDYVDFSFHLKEHNIIYYEFFKDILLRYFKNAVNDLLLSERVSMDKTFIMKLDFLLPPHVNLYLAVLKKCCIFLRHEIDLNTTERLVMNNKYRDVMTQVLGENFYWPNLDSKYKLIVKKLEFIIYTSFIWKYGHQNIKFLKCYMYGSTFYYETFCKDQAYFLAMSVLSYDKTNYFNNFFKVLYPNIDNFERNAELIVNNLVEGKMGGPKGFTLNIYNYHMQTINVFSLYFCFYKKISQILIRKEYRESDTASLVDIRKMLRIFLATQNINSEIVNFEQFLKKLCDKIQIDEYIAYARDMITEVYNDHPHYKKIMGTTELETYIKTLLNFE